MSIERASIPNTGRTGAELGITEFHGPHDATMIQLTQGFGSEIGPDEPGFIHLSANDAYRLMGALATWVKELAERKAEDYRAAIAENKALEKTIVKDAVECEHYIADLKVLDIPLRLLGLRKGK